MDTGFDHPVRCASDGCQFVRFGVLHKTADLVWLALRNTHTHIYIYIYIYIYV